MARQSHQFPHFSGYSGGGGSSGLLVQDEGSAVGTFSTINFIGADVRAIAGSGRADIYVPAPAYDSHWNTSDGDNGSQAVSESISRTTAYISTPNGGEGDPFKTGGWATANQPATTSTTATFTTAGNTTGFGGDCTVAVTLYDANGSSVLETYTTPALTQNGTSTSNSGRIAVTVSNYGANGNRFSAKMSVVVSAGAILTSAGLAGGRCHAVVTQTTDSATDGTGPYTYTQAAVFIDTNPTTPSINAPTIAENSATTKFLSGLEYYTTGSTFTVNVTNIDQLNRNTARTSANLRLTASNYGLSALNQSPFGTGSGNFSGWTSANNIDNVTYQNTGWAVSSSNFRYTGTSAKASAYPRDPWANGSTGNSANASILVDTYGTASTDTFEGFDDENRRQTSTYNSGNTAGNWTSTANLSAGEAMVYRGQLIVPTTATLSAGGATTTNWTSFSPDASNQPNYAGLSAPSKFYRSLVDSAGTSRASFTLTFTGTFISNATTDLANENLKVFIRRRASANGGGAGPASNALRLHGSNYNFATFDDGATTGGSYIREASSSSNSVNATFGGFSCETGIFIEVQIANAGIKVGSFEVTFY